MSGKCGSDVRPLAYGAIRNYFGELGDCCFLLFENGDDVATTRHASDCETVSSYFVIGSRSIYVIIGESDVPSAIRYDSSGVT